MVDESKFTVGPGEFKQPKTALTANNVLSFLTAVQQDGASKAAKKFAADESLLYYIVDAHRIESPITTKDEFKLDKARQNAQEQVEDLKENKRQKELENLEQGHANAAILEQALIPLNDSCLWFGENTRLSKSHEYDDWLNNTDLVMTLLPENEGEQPLYLAIDVTVSNDSSVLEKKINKIYSEIERGTLTTIKYFEDEKTREPITLNLVPRVIWPMDRETMEKFKKQIADYFSSKNRAAAENSDIPYALLLIIEKQLANGVNHLNNTEQRLKRLGLKISNYEIIKHNIQKMWLEINKRLEARQKICGVGKLDNLQQFVANFKLK